MMGLPTSEENEDKNSQDQDSKTDQTNNTTRDNSTLERMLLLEQKCQNLQKENNKLTRKIKIEQKKRKTAEAQITSIRDNQSWAELTRQEDEYFKQLEEETQKKEEESKHWGKTTTQNKHRKA